MYGKIIQYTVIAALILCANVSARTIKLTHLNSYAAVPASHHQRHTRDTAPLIQIFSVTDTTGTITHRALFNAERAITEQSWDLRRAWHTPLAQFAPGGIPVTFTRDSIPGDAGWHAYNTDGPLIDVATKYRPWSVSLSHEILETLADPTTTGHEVCDPAEISYYVRGIAVSDFALPTWFHNGAAPWDFLGQLTQDFLSPGIVGGI